MHTPIPFLLKWSWTFTAQNLFLEKSKILVIKDYSWIADCFRISFFYLFDLTECCGTTTVLETDSSGCITFPFQTEMTPAFIVRNERTTLCYIFNDRVTMLPLAWNRTFTCTYSNATFNLNISDIKFSDAGLFSLKVSTVLVQNVTLEVHGKPFL